LSLFVQVKRILRAGRRISKQTLRAERYTYWARAYLCHCHHRRSLSQLGTLSLWCGKAEREAREKPEGQQGTY